MTISNDALHRCISTLKSGGCIAYPTEAVWGLGCDPFDEAAVKTILKIKQRPVEKGLILIASCIEQVDFLVHDLAEETLSKLTASWPGHTTWLIPHQHRIPAFISGDSAKVAVRVSAHPIVKQLCDGFGGAIVSTSANPAGKASATTEQGVKSYFPREPLAYATGDVGPEKKASTIIDAETLNILRA